MIEDIAENNKFTMNNLWLNPTFHGSVTKFQFEKLQNCWCHKKVPSLTVRNKRKSSHSHFADAQGRPTKSSKQTFKRN